MGKQLGRRGPLTYDLLMVKGFGEYTVIWFQVFQVIKCDNGDETINFTISERSKLTQKEYKIRHDLVGKGTH